MAGSLEAYGWPLPEVLVDATPSRGDDCIRLNLAPECGTPGRQLRHP